MSTSRNTLLQDLGAEMGDVVTGTASGGSTTTIVDAANTASDSPLSASDDAQRFRGAWATVTTTTDMAAPQGQERRVSSYTIASWTVTLADALSVAPDAGDTFEIHSLLPRSEKMRCLNKALDERVFFRHFAPLTLITDGDFEADGTADFTATNATLTKSTTAAQIHRGVQSMQMVSTSTSASFYATAVPVTEGEQYKVEVTVSSSGRATFTLEAYDVTNSASIATADADYDDIGAWERISLQFSVPTNCRSLRIYCKCSATSVTSWWDDLILYSTTKRTLNLPSWCTEELFEWVYRRTSNDPDKWELAPLREARPQFNPAAATGGRVSISGDGLGSPLYVSGRRPYGAIGAVAAAGAPTVALAGSGAGNVNTGAHYYKITYLTADGESAAGTASAVVTTTSGDGQVSVSAIPTSSDSRVIGRRLWRTRAAGSIYYYLGVIANNTATTFADNVADSSLGVQAPKFDWTYTNAPAEWARNALAVEILDVLLSKARGGDKKALEDERKRWFGKYVAALSRSMPRREDGGQMRLGVRGA